MLALSLLLLAAPGDVRVLQAQPSFTLTAPERTSLGNGISAKWPAAVLSSIVGFHAEQKDGLGSTCSPYYSAGLTAASLFTLMKAVGATVAPGLAATEQKLWLTQEPCGGALGAAIVGITTARQANATATRLRSFDCTRTAPTSIDCTFTWGEPYSQAALFALYQTATSPLVSDGTE
jgi:hypothetical protein